MIVRSSKQIARGVAGMESGGLEGMDGDSSSLATGKWCNAFEDANVAPPTKVWSN